MSKKPYPSNNGQKVVLILLILIMIAATAFVVWLCFDLTNKTPQPSVSEKPGIQLPVAAETQTGDPVPTTEATLPPETTLPPEPEKVVSTASISVQGDLLMHQPVFITCQKDGVYNFESLFRYCRELISSYDYALANLETTFGGDKYKYQGNPEFNCPDPLAESVREAGYDMLLTANNHAADTRSDGIVRLDPGAGHPVHMAAPEPVEQIQSLVLLDGHIFPLGRQLVRRQDHLHGDRPQQHIGNIGKLDQSHKDTSRI